MGAFKIKLPGGWLVIGGGSGGGGGVSVVVDGPDAPPAVPTIYDDEFTGNALDPKWSPQFGPTNITIEKGQLYFRDVMIRPIRQQVPVDDTWEFTAKFIIPAWVDNFANFGMTISNDTATWVRTLTVNWGNCDLISFQLATDGSYQNNAVGGRPLFQCHHVYLRIRKALKDGVPWVYYSISRDGYYYQPYVDGEENMTMPGHIKYIGIYGSDQIPGSVVFRCEWFRRTA